MVTDFSPNRLGHTRYDLVCRLCRHVLSQYRRIRCHVRLDLSCRRQHDQLERSAPRVPHPRRSDPRRQDRPLLRASSFGSSPPGRSPSTSRSRSSASDTLTGILSNVSGRARRNSRSTTTRSAPKHSWLGAPGNDIVDRSLLAEYQVRKAPTPAKYMPTEEDMQKMLVAVMDYWDPAKNPDVRYNPLPKRLFHRDRNYAAIIGLLDTACRIGELLNLKMDDYQPSERQITIRVSKGREPRAIPVSREWQSCLDNWLKVRKRVMGNVPAGEDQGWLFISETGSRLEEERFLKTLKKYVAFAGASDRITLHSLRRYSLNRLAKHNLLMAQTIAGHKETKTTLLYTKLDPDFIRDMHDQVGVVRGIVESKKEAVRRKRLV